MVLSLGFLSILFFGAILARAGLIVAVIFDDAIRRWGKRLVVFAKGVGSMLFWGCCSVMWMLILAQVTRTWKNDRLAEEADDFDYWDGVWFAYISTTTVGLGDIFLEPELLIARDLFVFSLLFLGSFTLLSAFLSEISKAMSQEKETLVGSILRELQPRDNGTDSHSEQRKEDDGDKHISPEEQ